jgi:hypothetical protein
LQRIENECVLKREETLATFLSTASQITLSQPLQVVGSHCRLRSIASEGSLLSEQAFAAKNMPFRFASVKRSSCLGAGDRTRTNASVGQHVPQALRGRVALIVALYEWYARKAMHLPRRIEQDGSNTLIRSVTF